MSTKSPPPDDLVLYHLTEPGCSGKLVRCRVLTIDQVDAVLVAAGKTLDETATNLQLSRAEQRIGVETMAVDVSAAPVAKPTVKEAKGEDGAITREVVDPTLDPSIRWETFDRDARPRQLKAKDWLVLMHIYTREYGASQTEVDRIMGKARPVSTA